MPDPQTVKTPYSDEIETLYEEIQNIKSSSIITDTMTKFVKAKMKAATIDAYLENLMLE